MKLPQFINRWLTGTRRPYRGRQRRSARWNRFSVDTLEQRLLLTIDIQLDYTYDTNNFFAEQSRRDVLEAAAAVFESRITDDLTAISPAGADTWTATFNHPSTGTEVRVTNLEIPADTVIIYVGGRSLGGELARGGPAGFSSGASSAFQQNLRSRGESGIDGNAATESDVAPWGGTFLVNTAANWNLTLGLPTAQQNDLYSVALHEFSHVLGFGTTNAFSNARSGGNFVGTRATELFGGPVPLHSDQTHLASDTSSTIPSTSITQEALLDPQIKTGTRKSLTELDWAVLDDIGWDIAPPAPPVDYGDAPDSAEGNSVFNYSTRLAENGPSHVVTAGLFIGDSPPDGDDVTRVGGGLDTTFPASDDITGTDDEGFPGAGALAVVKGTVTSIDVAVTNTTGSTATLHGWIDYNSNGQFEAEERASTFIPSGTVNGAATLDFPAFGDPESQSRVMSYARFRLSTDSAAATPIGPASDGEVEDHRLELYSSTTAYDSLPSFNWPAAATAHIYEVEVDNLATGHSRFLVDSYIDGQFGGTISYRAKNAFPPGRYQWRYRPLEPGTITEFSPYSTFTVFERPATPIITDPVGSAVDSLPTFAWSPVTDATRYELWVNGEGRQRIIYQTNLTRTSFTPTTGLRSGDYTAWVRAYNQAGPLGAWSQPFEFTVSNGQLAAMAAVTDPGVGTSTNTVPTIGWRPTGGTSYRVLIRDVDSNSNVIDARAVTGTSYTVADGLPPGNYNASVFVNGLSGPLPTIALVSPNFRIEGVTGQAQLTVPKGNSESPLPIFGWTAVSGATRYELWVDDVSNGVSRVIHSSTLTTTGFATKDPLLPGDYRAWIRAFNGQAAIGTWSEQVDFRVTESTDVPTIWAPINTSLDSAPTIAWSSVKRAQRYSVSIVQDGPVLELSDVTTNWISLDRALEPGTYTLSVTAYAADRLGTDIRPFTIGSSTGPVEIFGPRTATSNTRPTFSWTAIDAANRYFVWINDATRNISGTILESDVGTTAFTPDAAMLPGDYRVWVRAFNGSIPVTGWSAAKSFRISERTLSPVITSPISNTDNTVPTITWTAQSGAASYQVVVDDVSNNISELNGASQIASTSWRPSEPLQPGTYTVRVISFDSNGELLGTSESHTFAVNVSSAAGFVNPLNREALSGTNLTFAWKAVTNATTYELWVNHVESNTVKLYHEAALTGLSYVPTGTVASGRYRAWVRAIDSNGIAGPWSRGLDFRVAAT